MSDDLVRRLRCYADLNDAVFHPWVYGEAADRIEKLETNFQLQLEWYLSNKRVLDDRIEKLEAALRPFARAEYISTGFDGNAIFARLQYAKDATETIPLAALEEARKALEGKDD